MLTCKNRYWKPHIVFIKRLRQWRCRDIRCCSVGDTKEEAFSRWLYYLSIFKGVTWDDKQTPQNREVPHTLYQVPQAPSFEASS